MMTDADKLKYLMETYEVDEAGALIMVDRQKVYGEPYNNHQMIADGWLGLLQPWAIRLLEGLAIPPHVVALCMAELKMCRSRLTYHADNYIDQQNYLAFAKAWQKRWGDRMGVFNGRPDATTTMRVKAIVWSTPNGEEIRQEI